MTAGVMRSAVLVSPKMSTDQTGVSGKSWIMTVVTSLHYGRRHSPILLYAILCQTSVGFAKRMQRQSSEQVIHLMQRNHRLLITIILLVSCTHNNS